jgi:hypothetical protein
MWSWNKVREDDKITFEKLGSKYILSRRVRGSDPYYLECNTKEEALIVLEWFLR